MRAFTELSVAASTKLGIDMRKGPQRLLWRFLNETRERIAGLIFSWQDLWSRLEHAESALAEALETGKRREKFIAVLAHDLRNSLQSIGFGTEAIGRKSARCDSDLAC